MNGLMTQESISPDAAQVQKQVGDGQFSSGVEQCEEDPVAQLVVQVEVLRSQTEQLQSNLQQLQYYNNDFLLLQQLQ